MTQPRLLGGRYELDGVIGRGGMAEVYRARDLRLDRTVAVKTLRSDMARDPTFQARFSREAQSAASLNHPSVIAVYDTGEDRIGDTPVPYIVMEFVEGSTLRELLQENRRLLPEKAMEITDGILRALDYSHRGGIIHRDIKPANVMLTRNHEVKVMDFGIARAMADTGATMTQTAQVIGTAQYLSPEQARGERVDARSDIYSTGCVLYELLTGRPPFTGDSPVSIAYQHVREEPVPPSHIDPDIPAWADAIVLKSMAKDADMRYQSATEFRADIQRAIQGQPVSATAASTMLLGGGPPQGTQVMGGPARTQVQRPTDYGLPPVQYEDRPGRRGSGKKAFVWVALAVLFIGGAALIGLLLTNGSDGGNKAADTIAIPDVANMSASQAKQRLESEGFKVSSEVKRKFSDSVDRGKVIETDPAASEKVKKGSTVTLVVSRGVENPEVTVPSVVGQTQASASRELSGAGFRVETRTEKSDDVPRGRVISTDPDGGERAAKGSEVTMVVSSGQDQATVPGVIGLTKDDARNALRDAGLRVDTRDAPPGTPGTPGTVINQSPGEGQKVPQGTTVVIIVAPEQPTGPPPTTDPPNRGPFG